MKQSLLSIFATSKSFLVKHKKLTLGALCVALLLPILVLTASLLLIGSYRQYIIPAGDPRHHAAVGIVLGAGITSKGKPYKELQARLDVAAQAVHDGQVDKLILSGDNRFKWYDEPGAMMRYLENVKHIPASKLQPDYAGRDTYDSCKRAAQVFGLKDTIIFSANSHLPRAIFLCRHLGVTAYGVSSGVEAANAWSREPLARIKALLNVYVHGRNTILGPPIRV